MNNADLKEVKATKMVIITLVRLLQILSILRGLCGRGQLLQYPQLRPRKEEMLFRCSGKASVERHLHPMIPIGELQSDDLHQANLVLKLYIVVAFVMLKRTKEVQYNVRWEKMGQMFPD